VVVVVLVVVEDVGVVVVSVVVVLLLSASATQDAPNQMPPATTARVKLRKIYLLILVSRPEFGPAIRA
jgi:hypothetical protein